MNSSNGDLKNLDDDSFSASSVTDNPRPPDGGWGWAVVFASFMIHVLGKLIPNRVLVQKSYPEDKIFAS